MDNKQQLPMVTTIIPTYKRPKHLRRAIRSALSQTYPHLKVCVYDNASGDETASVVADFANRDPRVRYFCHSENIGAYQNFLYGMMRIETAFFSFLSDDDVILPDFYRLAVDQLLRYAEAMFVATGVIVFKEDGQLLNVRSLDIPSGLHRPPEGFIQMVQHLPPTWTGVLFRRAVIERVGLLNLDVGIPADYEFELRVASQCSYAVIHDIGALFSSHESSLSSGDKYRRILLFPEGRIEMLRQIKYKYQVDRFARRFAVHMLSKRHCKALIRSACQAACQINPCLARDVISVLLKVYGSNLPIIFYSLLSLLREMFMRRWFNHGSEATLKKADIERQYGGYVKYLTF